MSGRRSIVVHGHFYQPPREDPWLDVVEAEPSAAPWHDWNRRIERECYRAVVAARVPGAGGRIARIVNTLATISFDFGPTLLAWLERETPGTYAAVLEADRVSRAAHAGHGNAIAMPAHHAILPLSSRRDKTTEVRWGIADFRRRFGREPEGMWLPETAVDEETLDVLAAEGIAFTILAPHQVNPLPAHGLPGRYRTASGKTIALFVYDGPISHDVAFGPLIKDARAWAERLVAPPARRLVSVATDGETYGHHHRFGEMALAALLEDLAARPLARVENFAAFLARNPPTTDVALVAPSSWSCPHGVERWRAECGCRMAPERTSQQRWRSPLREAVDWLAGELHALFEREGAGLFGDPWAARERYGADVAAGRAAAGDARERELLEMERQALRAFTSCGWFFDDIAGLESLQVLRYAARAIELAGADAARLEAGLLERLARAESNDASQGTGRDLYLARVKPPTAAPVRVAAGHAALHDVAPRAAVGLAGYAVRLEGDRVTVTDSRTARSSVFHVSVERREAAQITVGVAGSAGEAWRLSLADLGERHREAVKAELRRTIAERRLAPHEVAAAVEGGETFAHIVGDALAGAVAALGFDASEEARARVRDLAALLDLVGFTVPFDVQTTFYRIRAAASPERSAALAPLSERLGFLA
jgi:alpha-amylase/alpha-mannosidase (GH57 family)